MVRKRQCLIADREAQAALEAELLGGSQIAQESIEPGPCCERSAQFVRNRGACDQYVARHSGVEDAQGR
jgi:hypothetical protein